MSKIEQRLENSAEIQEESMKFTKKALKELTGFQNYSQQQMSPKGIREKGEEVMFNGINIAALGGDSPARITKNIAEALFTPSELASVVIDPQKTLISDRRAADEYRTNLYKQAVRVALGSQYTPDLYKKTLKLVNQKGLYVHNRVKKTPIDNENTPIDDRCKDGNVTPATTPSRDL